jgi:large subunit ribosomal protein L34e
MPRPALRSRSFRKVKLKIPGGASITHYFKREPSKAKCGRCKSILHGVKNLRPVSMKKLPKSKKTTSRLHGGNLCSSCTREVVKERARSVSKR